MVRASGETVGNYAITIGSLSAGANYTVAATAPASLGITAAATVTPPTPPATVGLTPAIVAGATTASSIADQVATLTTTGPIPTTQPAGSGSGFDGNAVFGWNGTNVLPGTQPLWAQFGAGQLDAVEGDVLSLEGMECKAGDDDGCIAANGTRLPHTDNRLIAPDFKFVIE